MRPHRRGPTEHVLIAGDVEDLDHIRAVLALLSPDAYGQVLVEVAAGRQLPSLPAPARVTVHRVRPASLAGAITAWTDEWMPEEPDSTREVTVWVGAHVDIRLHPLGDLAERL